jgi:hypothetical protein
MMKLQLPSGAEVRVGISHFPYGENPTKRATRVWLRQTDGQELQAESICKSPDNFSKAIGRRLAANHLLRKIRQKGLFSKADRREIFFCVCPEFSNKAKP